VFLQAAGAAGLVTLAKAPAFAQATPKKLVFAHVTAEPEFVGGCFCCDGERSDPNAPRAELQMEFHGGTC